MSRMMIAALMLLVLAGGCTETNNNAPTQPAPPGGAPLNNSTVTARAMGVCPAGGPCVADFAVSLSRGEEVAWVFAGAQPPTSPVQAGSVSWPSPGPKTWTSQVCTQVPECTGGQGTVTFVSSVVAASTAVAVGLITQGQSAELIAVFDRAAEDGDFSSVLAYVSASGIDVESEEFVAFQAALEAATAE